MIRYAAAPQFVMHMFRALAIVVVMCALAAVARGNEASSDGYVLPNTEVLSIHSRVTGVDYRIYVALPSDYERDSSRDYPALFVLDADYSFAIARNILEHLADRGHVRAALVFGIGYADRAAYRLNRTRDYTPTFVASGGYGPDIQKHSGGAPRFQRFIASELIPFLEKRYRMSDHRVLSGHSFGGLFTAWSMSTRQELFSAYLGISPSLWYDNGLLLDPKRQSMSRLSKSPISAYFAVGSLETGGSGRHPMLQQLRRWTDALRSVVPANSRIEFEAIPSHSHDTVYPTALTNGLLLLFPTETPD